MAPRLFWNDLTDDGLLEPESRLTLEDRPRGLFADSAAAEQMTRQELLREAARDCAPARSASSTNSPPARRATSSSCWRGASPTGTAVAGAHRPGREVRRRGRAQPLRDSLARRVGAASHLHRELRTLEAETLAFVDALYGGSLDPSVADAVGANIAAARSTTVFVRRDAEPRPRRRPGVRRLGGVVRPQRARAKAPAPTSGRTPRPSHGCSRRSSAARAGSSSCSRPTTREPRSSARNRVFGGASWFMTPAVDGQLGTLLRLHREWRFSGDDDFLRELWPAASRTLEYAIREWDTDADGLLDGELHNTYDIEFHGDRSARQHHVRSPRCGPVPGWPRTSVRRRVPPTGSTAPNGWLRGWTSGSGTASTTARRSTTSTRHRYQYGEGVLSDQLLGQFHAYLNGLGRRCCRPTTCAAACGAIVRAQLPRTTSPPTRARSASTR